MASRKGSKNKESKPRPNRAKKKKACPDLGKSGHGSDCSKCGGSGEVDA